MALMAASVPEFTMRTMSMEGTISAMVRAISISSSVGAPKLVPRGSCASRAFTTDGCPCPRIMGPQEQT
jgi:hypothetical protein